MKAIDRIEFFGETRDVESTILVNYWIGIIAKSTETVKRYKEKPLLAEHGFAALIDLKHADIRILWDAGIAPITLDGPVGAQVPGNLRLLRERSCDMMAVGSAKSSGRRHYVSASHHGESLREDQQEQNVAAIHQLLLQLDE